jgi:hypothetical protein
MDGNLGGHWLVCVSSVGVTSVFAFSLHSHFIAVNAPECVLPQPVTGQVACEIAPPNTPEHFWHLSPNFEGTAMNQSKTSAGTLPPVKDQTTSPTLGQSGVGRASPKNSHAKTGGTSAGNAFLEMTARLISDPSRLVQAQLSLWNDHLTLCQRTTQRFLGGATEPVIEPSAGAGAFGMWRGPTTRYSISSSRGIC